MIIEGRYDIVGGEVFVDGTLLLPHEMRLYPHNSKGFAWGDGGPSHLAFSILAIYGVNISVQYYQDFQRQFIAPLEPYQPFKIEIDLEQWVYDEHNKRRTASILRHELERAETRLTSLRAKITGNVETTSLRVKVTGNVVERTYLNRRCVLECNGKGEHCTRGVDPCIRDAIYCFQHDTQEKRDRVARRWEQARKRRTRVQNDRIDRIVLTPTNLTVNDDEAWRQNPEAFDGYRSSNNLLIMTLVPLHVSLDTLAIDQEYREIVRPYLSEPPRRWRRRTDEGKPYNRGYWE